MSRTAALRAQTASIEELFRVVTAMRSLAAAQVQNAERALPGVRRYAEIVTRAVRRARALVASPFAVAPELPPRLAVVCSERGFVGAFNERLIERAAAEPEAAAGHLWILGTRGIQLARARHLAAEWTLPMASHVAGVLDAARAVAAEVERRLARGELGRFAVLAAREAPGAPTALERRQLLPAAEASPAADDAPPPLHHLAPLDLLGRLVGEHVAGELVRVLVESFASENAARLHAMESARQHIDDKLRALRDEANRLRQEEITAELLDVITGAEAVRRD